MIPDWETDCVYLSRLLVGRHPVLHQQLTGILADHGVPVRLLDRPADIWARDYCPVKVGNHQFVKFRYWPDYLRDRHKHLITPAETICQQLDGLGQCRQSALIVDGGNVIQEHKGP